MTVITVFRSRLQPGTEPTYETLSAEISHLARSMPGFLEEKTFISSDGERVTLVLFSDATSHAAWRDHPRHREAQEIGRSKFYSEYQIYTAVVDFTASFGPDVVS